MWKYQCKKHLLILLGAFILGALLMGVFGYQKDMVVSTAQQFGIKDTMDSSPFIYYFIGGISLAGIANGLLLSMYAVMKFNIPFLFALLGILLLSSVIAGFGVLSLIPCVIVAIYGWASIPNKGKRKELAKGNLTSVAEVERVYRLHHTYVAEYEELGKKAWRTILKMNLVFGIGLIVLIFIVFFVKEVLILLAAMVLWFILFMQLAKLKSQALQPIVSLLYDKCHPEACASAIFALAKKTRKKRSFPMPQQLAQCMIYLNDPNLAIDILATCNQTKGNFIFAYHSLMAYAYYQLGDESMVKYNYEQCEKTTERITNGPMLVIKKECLGSIQNKLDLMQKSFGKARTFFEADAPNRVFEFQKVDAKYYLGLIAFIDRDLDEASDAFGFVEVHGGSIYYVEKARNFLKIIKDAQAQQEDVE